MIKEQEQNNLSKYKSIKVVVTHLKYAKDTIDLNNLLDKGYELISYEYLDDSYIIYHLGKT